MRTRSQTQLEAADAKLNPSAAPFVPTGKRGDLDSLTQELRSVRVDNSHVESHPRRTSRSASPVASKRGPVESRSSPEIEKAKFPPVPSAAYLAAAALAPRPRTELPDSGVTVKPQLVVLDLNGTLCLRPKKNAAGARKAVPRPFVSTFLEYLLHPVVRSDETIQPRFAVAIWSSAQHDSVAAMTAGLGLGSSSAATLLEAVWDREFFGLPAREYHSNVKVVKDLERVWSAISWQSAALAGEEVESSEAWSQYDTVLIDDSPHKAVLQPSNHLCVPEFAKKDLDKSDDPALLSVVGVLEALRAQSNVSACLREGAWIQGSGELKEPRQWALEGQAALRDLRIKATAEYDAAWVKRVHKRWDRHR